MTHKIKGIAENNVEYIPTKTMIGIDDKEVIVYDEENKVSYGQNKIDEERTALLAQKAEIESYSKVSKLSDINDKISILDEIQTEMDKLKVVEKVEETVKK